MIRLALGCAQLVNVAKAHWHRHSSVFTYKRTTTPKLTVGCWCSTTATPTGRLKREDFRHTHFDSAFSQWKILSRPSDWENYLMGKEGAERYRTQNLPNITPNCPGLYEFAIVYVPPGRKFSLSSSVILVVYVGQTQNLRARIQQYGRNGAHLENRFLNFITTSPSHVFSSPAALFSDVFSKGYTIVYRSAPMKSKRDAEEIEDDLLRKYDYAWNKRRNGDRRPGDIHKMLDEYSRFSLVNMIRQYFHQIKSRDPFMISAKNQNKSATAAGLHRIKKLLPRQVGRRGCNEHSTSCICGVAIGPHGSSNICAKPPVPGRKRCAEHKGMKVDGLIKTFQREGNAPDIIAGRHNQKSNNSIVTRKRYASERKFCSYLWYYVGRWFTY